MNETQSNWTLRPPKPADISFVYDTWLRSYRSDSTIGKNGISVVFYRNYSRVIDRILQQPDTEVRVAVLPDDQDVILGYAVFQGSVIHYVYVKEAFRNLGIATDLLAGTQPAEYSHRTFTARGILDRHPELTYNPFLLFQQAQKNLGDSQNESQQTSHH